MEAADSSPCFYNTSNDSHDDVDIEQRLSTLKVTTVVAHPRAKRSLTDAEERSLIERERRSLAEKERSLTERKERSLTQGNEEALSRRRVFTVYRKPSDPIKSVDIKRKEKPVIVLHGSTRFGIATKKGIVYVSKSDYDRKYNNPRGLLSHQPAPPVHRGARQRAGSTGMNEGLSLSDKYIQTMERMPFHRPGHRLYPSTVPTGGAADPNEDAPTLRLTPQPPPNRIPDTIATPRRPSSSRRDSSSVSAGRSSLTAPQRTVMVVQLPEGIRSHPLDVAVDSSGNMIVCREESDRATVYGETGEKLHEVLPSDDDAGRAVTSVAATRDNQQFVVVRSGVANVVRVRRNGRVTKALVPQSDGDTIRGPGSVVCTTTGRIVVGYWTTNTVFVFDIRGKQISRFGGFGPELGKFGNFRSLKLGPENEIIIADPGFKRVQVFSDSGEFLFFFDSVYNSFSSGEPVVYIPYSAVADPNWYVLVSEMCGDKVHIYKRDAPLDGVLVSTPVTHLRSISGFHWPQGMCLTPRDCAAVTEYRSGTLRVFSYRDTKRSNNS